MKHIIGGGNRMAKDNIFELEKNKIENICISEDMTDYEKGKLIKQFMTLFDLTQTQVAELLNLYRHTINRWVLVYQRESELSDEIKELIKEESDRTWLLLMRIKEPNLVKKQKFFLTNKKGLMTSQQEKLISVMNGQKTIDQWQEEEKKRYDEIRRLLNKIKKELLLLGEG